MFRLVSDHPLASALLVLCALVLAARAYFRVTKRFLERFDELPERRFLSASERLVLGFPRSIESAGLARLDARYQSANRIALGVAVLVLLTLAVQRAVLADEPLARLAERIASVRGELELEWVERGRAADPEAPASERAKELALRLDELLKELDARAANERAPLDDALIDLRRRSAALLANARGSFASTLDLVTERELEREARETDERVERELDLALLRARALRGLDRTERALELYQRAIALRPERADLRLETARALADAGRFDGAGEELDAAIALDRKALARGEEPERERRLADSLALRASLARRGERVADALRDLDEAVALRARLADARPELEPIEDRARDLAARGLALAELGRMHAARADLDAAVALRERALARADEREATEHELALADAALERARVADALGEPELALTDLERVVELRERAVRLGRTELAPVLAEARAERAALRLERGDDAALAELEAALSQLARSASESGDPALELAEGRARLAHVRALARAGRGDEAWLESASALAPTELAARGAFRRAGAELVASLREERASILAARGDESGAIAELDVAITGREAELARTPESAAAIELVLSHARRGALRTSRGSRVGALDDLDRAVELARGESNELGAQRELALGFALRRRAAASLALRGEADARADLEAAIEALSAVGGGADELALARAALDRLDADATPALDAEAPEAPAAPDASVEEPAREALPASAQSATPPESADASEVDAPPPAMASGTVGALESERGTPLETNEAATADDASRALELEGRARRLAEQGEAAASARALDEAIALRERLEERDAASEPSVELARDLCARADARSSAGATAAALADWARAIELAERARGADPSLAADAHRARAELLAQNGELGAALDDACAAVDALRETARDGEVSPRELARALELRARIHARAARFAPAESDLGEAIDLRRALARPGAADADELALAEALADRALCAFDRHDGARALRDLDEAIGLVAPLVELGGRTELEAELARWRERRALVLRAAEGGR